MRRRDFTMIVAGAPFFWSNISHAQQAPSLWAHGDHSHLPVVGFLRSTPAAPFKDIALAFREGLGETGLIDRRNVWVEERWADNQKERLPELAADLIRFRPAVIVGNQQAIQAAQSLAPTTPAVFVIGEDPVKAGLVASLSRPNGNITGVTFFGGSELNVKRVELLHQLVPNASTIGVLGDPGYAPFEAELPEVRAAAEALGLHMFVAQAGDPADFESAFTKIKQSGAAALLVSGSPLFTSERDAIVGLAAKYGLPAAYDLRTLVIGGGLISYSSSFRDAYRQAGVYAGRIVKGAKTADLPVQQPTKFELVINLGTAKALGLTVPQTLLTAATELIE